MSVVRCNLRTVRNAIANFQDFLCNKTLSGEWVSSKPMTGQMRPDTIREMDGMFLKGNKFFVVKSYATPIAVYNPAIGWWISKEGYSVTTKRHISALGLG